MSLELAAILETAEKLTPFNQIATDILKKIEDPLSSADDFVELIEQDQVMVSQTLKFANSAFYGYPRKIIGLKNALTVMGLDTLKSIIIAISARVTMKTLSLGYGLGKTGFYEHSLSTAIIARRLAKYAKIKKKEKIFIYALLHDIGKLLLDPFIDQRVSRFQKAIIDGELSVVEAERAVIGFDHCEIGARLAEMWNFPSSLINVIRNHHDPSKAIPDERNDIAVVQAANILSYTGNVGGITTDFEYDISKYEKISSSFNLRTIDIENILSDISPDMIKGATK